MYPMAMILRITAFLLRYRMRVVETNQPLTIPAV
jgi:hypothetical protein